MIYMGSKAKYAQYIVPILQKEIDTTGTDTYIECFVGGANIIDKIKCAKRFGFDRSETLIALLQQAATDFSKIPTSCSREKWDEGKAYVKDNIQPTTMTLADIGAAEFLASYSRGGFPRGYANSTDSRNYYQESYRNLKRQSPNLAGIIFKAQSYEELSPDTRDAVIYLDPPYQGTKSYSYATQPKMNYEHFWNWVRQISKCNSVFVSEQNAPDDFESIWEKEANRTMSLTNKFKTMEHLFRWKG